MSDSQTIPPGTCQCGCGRKTKLATRTNTKNGWKQGEPLRYIKGHSGSHGKGKPVEARFWSRVDKNGPGGCWIWTGSTSGNGYGNLIVTGTVGTGAHRYSYELHKGPIPEGMTVDHMCNTPACVNPDHLEVASQEENTRRANLFRALPVFCPHGHRYYGDNLYIRPNGGRECRECRRESVRRAKRKRMAAK